MSLYPKEWGMWIKYVANGGHLEIQDGDTQITIHPWRQTGQCSLTPPTITSVSNFKLGVVYGIYTSTVSTMSVVDLFMTATLLI